MNGQAMKWNDGLINSARRVDVSSLAGVPKDVADGGVGRVEGMNGVGRVRMVV